MQWGLLTFRFWQDRVRTDAYHSAIMHHQKFIEGKVKLLAESRVYYLFHILSESGFRSRIPKLCRLCWMWGVGLEYSLCSVLVLAQNG